MNSYQKVTLLLGMIVVIAMSCFPPWVKVATANDLIVEHPGGYHFLLAPPEVGGAGGVVLTYRVDYERLYAQWILVFVVTGVWVLVFVGRRAEE